MPYKTPEGANQHVVIPVTLNGRTTAQMALDTGASGTVLFLPLAVRVGALREGDGALLTQVSGIGGKATAAKVILDSVSVTEARSDFVIATVTDRATNAFEGLVGMDFLGGFTIEIDTQEHVVFLTERPANRDAPAGHDEAWWRRSYREVVGERTLWQEVESRLKERASSSLVSAGGEADELKKLIAFAEYQSREARRLEGRLDRHAANNDVPLEWRH